MFENLFSRRKGYTPLPVQGNTEETSDHARNHLWDIFYVYIYRANLLDAFEGPDLHPTVKAFFRGVWAELYHGRIDEYPGYERLLGKLKGDFLQGAWHFPFDIFEAIFEISENLMRDPEEVAFLIRDSLERENQAYTFVGGQFIERMTPQEIDSVEVALQTPIEAVREHFQTARSRCSVTEMLPILGTASRSRSARLKQPVGI